MARMSTVPSRSLPTSSLADRAAQAADRLAAVPRLREGALILASLLLALSAAQWTWALIAPVPVAGAPVMPSNTVPAATFNVTAIEQAGLFGMTPLTSRNLNAIPVSSLNLVLTGLVDAGAHSYALIRANGAPEAPFGVGQAVLPGVTVAAVYGDRVILRHDGRVESLLLKQPATGGALGANPSYAAPPVQQMTPNQYRIPKMLLRKEMASPQKLMTQALMVPYAGGGFLVRSLEPGSLYQKLGLQPGDVVQAVNGQPLRSVQQAMQIYGQLPNANAIDLQILRHGKAQDLHYLIQ